MIIFLFCSTAFTQLQAIILLRTGDHDENTSAPTGELLDSGWQYLGDWGSFLGTVIGPKHFITARHIGGEIGKPFEYQGETYTTTGFYEIGRPDLRVWEICGEFPGPYAPLYSQGDEADKELVFFGRGANRGAEVWIETGSGPELRGWRQGDWDKRRRWGENVVTFLGNLDERDPPDDPQYLVVDFDRDGLPNEASVGGGDSGGGVFIRDGDHWALAGINVAADSPFSFQPAGDGFHAALFDAGGMYYIFDKEEGWVYLRDRVKDLPAAFYSQRISNHISEIQAILGGEALFLEEEPWVVSSEFPGRGYASEFERSLDSDSRLIEIPIQGETRFYRLQGCEDYEITSIELSDTSVLIHYRVL